jgi:hypothetical protein
MAAYKLHFEGSDNRVVLAGHSHVLAVMYGIAESQSSKLAVAYSCEPAEGVPLDNDYWEYVRSVSLGKRVAVMWNGNQHHALFLVETDPPIAVWPAWRDREHRVQPRLSGLRRILRLEQKPARCSESLVPRSMLQAMWSPTFDQLRFALALLTPDREVVVVSTPPPKRQSLVRANLASELWFAPIAERLGVSVAELPITDEYVRLAMWETLHSQLREVCGEFGVTVIPVPNAAVDSQGFLLPQYSAPDATHANGDYGRLVAGVIEQWSAQ